MDTLGFIPKINNPILNGHTYGKDVYSSEYTYRRTFPSENYTTDALSQLDYGSILQMTANFRQSKGFDIPGHYYFRILFDFDKRANLLSLASDDMFVKFPWDEGFNEDQDILISEDALKTNHKVVNTAFNYLLINREWDRAKKLVDFVSLLSNVAKASPWYFSEVIGLDSALERKEVTEGIFKIEETRKSFQIKCLPDAFDTRISTLLDLYKDIVYSYSMHKEIVPANLRKFDMGILIFNTPIMNIHRGGNFSFREHILNGAQEKMVRKNSTTHSESVQNEGSQVSPVNQGTSPLNDDPNSTAMKTGIFASIDPSSNDTSKFKASVKYIEFQNCELDYNSARSAYSSMTNGEGFEMVNTINIFFDSAVEYRYNDQLSKVIGDVNYTDIFLSTTDEEVRDMLTITNSKGEKAAPLSSYYENSKKTFIGTPSSATEDFSALEKLKQKAEKTAKQMADTAIGYTAHQLLDPLLAKAKSLYLGNFYHTRPVSVISTIGGALNGNIIPLLEKGKQSIEDSLTSSNSRGWTVTPKKRFEGYTK